MIVSPTEARDALRAVDQTTHRSTRSTAYRKAAPILMVWGAIWMLGYAAPAIPSLPQHWIWPVLDGIGLVATALLTCRRAPAAGSATISASQLGKSVAQGLIVVLFIVATLVVMRPADPAQIRVFPPLVLGLVYGLFGVQALPALAWTGGIAAAASLLAFFFLPAWLSLVVAVFGGGALLVGGLVMRRM